MPKRRPTSPRALPKTPTSLPAPTASEAAFEELLRRFDAESPAVRVAAAPSSPVSSAAPFLEALFASKETYLERDPYGTIGETSEFNTKLVGVSFEGRQNTVAGLASGDPLTLVRQPENPKDANAIAVFFGALHVGFIRKEIARRVAPNIDGGDRYEAVVTDVTGGGDGRHVGVNIHVQRHRPRTQTAVLRAEPGAIDGETIRRALIGERVLRDAQMAVLTRVQERKNTLAIMGTGRGKSLCFQLPAAQRALTCGERTLVFYPLRALANDQYEALVRRLGPLGLRIFRANGAIDGEERARLDDALESGAWDIILATPEFAQYHSEAFARACNRPSLIVVDEAHHVFESRHRAAYASLGTLCASLGNPQILALTATAGDEAFAEVRKRLRIESWVVDPTVRSNLHVVDARATTDKPAYLERALEESGKAIVYANSRSEVTKVADRLRKRFGDEVAFYHAGVPSAQRATIEELFRSGAIRVVVATSAFGEGIDLPDVRDVVLYHLNFDFTEFNQQAGRAGRDGADARIHLIYGENDRTINDFIIGRAAPTLATLRELYRGMRGLAMFDVLHMRYDDIARTLDLERVNGETVAAAVRIFEEGGLIETGTDDDGPFVRFKHVDGRVDLTKTARFAEGEAERESFARFCSLALEADAATLEQIINRPIFPDRIPHVR
ncbi:MAG TPA: DEAD/DEAH box helicase [Candidatus Acidoferrales bacterium]|nr:DEAD/DEAH box helicase [Candidatus Acidoferrales bacterium]